MSVFLIFFPISEPLKTILHPFRGDLYCISLMLVRCTISSQSSAEHHFDNFYTLTHHSIFFFHVSQPDTVVGPLTTRKG